VLLAGCVSMMPDKLMELKPARMVAVPSREDAGKVDPFSKGRARNAVPSEESCL